MVALHGLWNGAAYLLTSDPALLFYYLLVLLPLFIGYIVAVVLLRRQEGRITVARLGEYAAAGWFTSREVPMLATGPGRRMLKGAADRVARADEAELLALVQAHRAVVIG
ncbi:hypothetical protein [Cryobacterium sp. GrIS_2_6]|uniref:hypothetical protein n=1 Tax=Cryobacterium sp. GrIS_2_6 TaxID=3162785 RepID=UPI002E0BC5D2|nr:hypothetical protein [Cryobacterium psychrotolerans]